jgi:glycerol-1-phosphatase
VPALAERYDSFLFDLDGVLYRGDQPIDGAAEAVRRLRDRGKGLAFVTNNSSRTPAEVVERLRSAGVEASVDEIVTSAVATAALLARRGGGSAFVIGETGIRTALAEAGIDVREGSPRTVDYVVVGWDRSADYDTLKTAALLVQRGAALVATNADASYPAPDGLWPGAGALLAAVTATTARPADEIVGKPHAPLFEMAAERAGGGRPLPIGDRLDTDIAGAAALGWDSLLVLTGVATRRDLVRASPLPTYVGPSLQVLFDGCVEVRAARDADRSRVAELLARAGLDEAPDSDLEAGRTLVTEVDSLVVGTASVEVSRTSALLRSLAVEEAHRGASIGTILVAHSVETARRAGAREVYAVTETAEPFFLGLGFDPAGSIDAVPAPLREFTAWCAETSSTLRLALGAAVP